MTGPEFPYLSVYQAEASIDFQVFFSEMAYYEHSHLDYFSSQE